MDAAKLRRTRHRCAGNGYFGGIVMEAEEAEQGQWAEFRAGLRRGWLKLNNRTSASHKRFVWAVIVVGAALRISQMGLGVIYDEAFTFTDYASKPVGFILSNYASPNNHILHTLLVKLSCALFGVHLWSLRLPALMAGIAVMPLFYVFVRAMFNRYIALLSLSFVAASGALIEYSALARGYSLTWFFMLCAMIAGRHFAKSNNMVSATLVALFNALGMWAVTTMVYAALSCYIWLFLYLWSSYDSSLRRRALRLLISFLTFLLLTALFYAPVIVMHSVDQLFHHPTVGENTWESFVATHQDKAFELWAYFTDTAATWISIAGMAGLAYAAYISSKYRVLLIAVVIGAVPLSVVQTMIGPPRVWTYILFNLHLSSGIAIFYLLKLVQERLYEGFSKRVRTVIASLIVLCGMGWLGITGMKDRLERHADARHAADWFIGVLKTGDRVYTATPNDAPFEFYLMVDGLDRAVVHRVRAADGRTYVLVGPGDGQTLLSVMEANNQRLPDHPSLMKVKDWKRLEIFAAPQ